MDMTQEELVNLKINNTNSPIWKTENTWKNKMNRTLGIGRIITKHLVSVSSESCPTKRRNIVVQKNIFKEEEAKIFPKLKII